MGVYRRVAQDGRVTWYVRWISHGREHRRAAGPTRGHAIKLLDRVIQERQEGRSGVHVWRPGPPQSVSDLVEAYITQAEARGKRSVERMRRLAKHIAAAPLGQRPARFVCEPDFDTYVARRKAQGVGPATTNRELGLVRAAMRAAERRGDLPRGATPRISLLAEPPGRCRVLTDAEQARVLRKCPAWLRRLVLLAVATGCRQGEILGLSWGAVDLDGRWLHLETTKSGRRRDVPLGDTAAELLREVRPPKPAAGALVFPTRNGTRLARSNLIRAWRLACRRAEVADCRWHDLRHTTGGRVATKTGSLLAVAVLLGHGTPERPNLAMAARYGHLADSGVRAAVDAIDPGHGDGQPEGKKEGKEPERQ